MKAAYRIIVLCVLVLPLLLILYKVFFLEYSYQNILPRTSYEVSLNLDLEGFGEELSVSTWLPVSNERQKVSNERQEAAVFALDQESDLSGRKVTWSAPGLEGESRIRYSFDVRAEAVEYQFDDGAIIPASYHPSFEPFLSPSGAIQSNHPRILSKVNELSGDNDSLKAVLRLFFEDVYNMGKRPFKGLTDALTALKLGEASCNGKSRLFVAYCRNKGIPARLVGGLILESGSKQTSHQWAEAFVNGYWVPFDALNGHFATIPHNYLELYKGDHYLFSHSPNIGFNYLFTMKRQLVSNPRLAEELKGDWFNSYAMWSAFERVGIPLSLLKVILLLPLGAMVVAIARNVIGFKTFGVFLPALIAVAISYTGLIWGLAAFVIVILLVSLLHFPLEKLGMLYTPKLVIMLVSVVITFVLLSIIGIQLDYTELAYITLFPVVVITITAERFARTIMEENFQRALVVTAQTLIVVLMAYFAMNSRTMESLFLAFPELFLIIIGIMLLLGRWIGLRVSEYTRFKYLIK